MKTALLIIDWEKEWINPKSDYYIGSDLKNETKKINQLIKYARKSKFKVIFVKHIELEGYSFRENTTSTEFIDSLDVIDEDVVIKKNKISAFYNTNLEEELKDFNHIIIAGILTNLCVRSAICDAYDRGFNITVIEDCCIAQNKEIQDFTLKDLMETRPELKFVILNHLRNN